MYESPNPWKPHVTVAAVCERQNRFLLVEELIAGKKVLNQPAGHLEAGESLSDAVIRECLEETGWTFQPEYLIGVYQWTHPHSSQAFLRFAFAGEVMNHDTSRQLDEGILGTCWLDAVSVTQDAHRLRSPLVLRCIDDYRKDVRYPLSLLTDIGSRELPVDG